MAMYLAELHHKIAEILQSSSHKVLSRITFQNDRNIAKRTYELHPKIT